MMMLNSVWNTSPFVGLARTTYIRCVHTVLFGRDLIKYTVICDAYIYTVLANPKYAMLIYARFWPALHMRCLYIHGFGQPCTFAEYVHGGRLKVERHKDSVFTMKSTIRSLHALQGMGAPSWYMKTYDNKSLHCFGLRKAVHATVDS